MFIYIIVKTGDYREFIDIVKIFNNRKKAMEFCSKINEKPYLYRYDVIEKKIQP